MGTQLECKYLCAHLGVDVPVCTHLYVFVPFWGWVYQMCTSGGMCTHVHLSCVYSPVFAYLDVTACVRLGSFMHMHQ